jgi:hypothetical protein
MRLQIGPIVEFCHRIGPQPALPLDITAAV